LAERGEYAIPDFFIQDEYGRSLQAPLGIWILFEASNCTQEKLGTLSHDIFFSGIVLERITLYSGIMNMWQKISLLAVAPSAVGWSKAQGGRISMRKVINWKRQHQVWSPCCAQFI
jgi:hypothetical protein